MTMLRLVLRELVERKAQLLMSFLAILLGVAVIVSIETMSHFSKIAVAQELDNLGANILIMPKDANVDNYYRSDFVDAFIPETYVRDIVMSDLKGLDNLSPRLVIPEVGVGDRKVNLTGVLPTGDFPKKPGWTQGADIFSKPEADCGTYTPNATVAENAVRRKMVNRLGPDECYVGSQVAKELNLAVGSKVKVKDLEFKVVEVLPETGTVDDTRLLAHLHTVQEMFKTGPVLNVIEVVG
ncbi:MAG: ABC transporter permease [Planctomycetota bacterium]|nr:ABC transporter permease [Planctomycetota bacterium]